MKKKSLVEEANERASIVLACQLVGVEVQEGRMAGSTKTYCPFGRFYHSDGGREAALRVYEESNSAYCFSCKKYFTPTTLLSEAWDISKKRAAAELLERVGYKPLSAAELWRQVQPEEIRPDTSMLGMALKTYCRRIDSDWSTRQFDKLVSDKLDKCLSLLEYVSTEEDSDRWLTACKQAMANILKKEDI